MSACDEPGEAAATSDREASAFRWIASVRPSFDPVVAEQRCGVGWFVPGRPFRIDLPVDLVHPVAVSVCLWWPRDRTWLPHLWTILADDSDQSAFEARELKAESEVRQYRVEFVVQTLTSIRTDAGVRVADVSPLAGASVVLTPFERGAPAWDAPRFVTGQDGRVAYGPIPWAEWYADISASGHAPVRALAPARSERQRQAPADSVTIFPSRTRHGRITYDGGRPPDGTCLRVRVEAYGGTSVPVYYALSESGAFAVEEPELGHVHYRVELPDGGVVQFDEDLVRGVGDRVQHDVRIVLD